MSSYFAIYHGWLQYGAERSVSPAAPEVLSWDFPAQASVPEAAARSAPVTLGETGRAGDGSPGWSAPLRRWLARQAVGERA
jgi:hypothetical protein